jgi:hypothetical protein
MSTCEFSTCEKVAVVLDYDVAYCVEHYCKVKGIILPSTRPSKNQ